DTWTVIGSEPESESDIVAVAGLVGREQMQVKRWKLPESEGEGAWAVTSPDSALEVRTRLRRDWYWSWPLLPALLGGQPLDSEIWHRGPEGDHRVAGAAGAIRCMRPTAEGVVCLGYGATRVAWVFRHGSPMAEPPALLPAPTSPGGPLQERLLGVAA